MNAETTSSSSSEEGSKQETEDEVPEPKRPVQRKLEHSKLENNGHGKKAAK